MSLWRRAAKRDSNEADLVQIAEAMGATCQPLSVLHGPDYLVGLNQRTALVEFKAEKGKLKDGQREWHSWWRGSKVHVVRNSSEMVAVVHQLRQEPSR